MKFPEGGFYFREVLVEESGSSRGLLNPKTKGGLG
jgi:hypothetical protein